MTDPVFDDEDDLSGYGSESGLSLVGIDPRTLVFTGLWLASFVLAPWLSEASAGTSSGRELGVAALEDPSVGAGAFYIKPNYSEAAGFGTWVATVGVDLTIGILAPADPDGAPVFNGVDSGSPTNAEPIVNYYGAGEHLCFAVVDFESIVNDNGGVFFPYNDVSIFYATGSNAGISVRRSGPGPFQYFVGYIESKGAVGDPASYDGQAGVEIEITDILNAGGGGRLLVQAKKEAGYVWLRVGTSPWVQGDAIDQLWTPAESALLVLGSSYGNLEVGDFTILAIGFYASPMPDETWSDLLDAWATTRFPP